MINMLEEDSNFKKLLPGLTQEEREALEESILRYGVIDPIIVWRGKIVDGYARYEICKKHELPFEIKEIECDTMTDVQRWIIESHLGRRHLSTIKKIEVVERYRDLFSAEAKERQGIRTDLKSASADDRIERNIPTKIREGNPIEKCQESNEVKPDQSDPYNNKEENDSSELRKQRRERETTFRLAKLAGVSETTYRRARVILQSGDSELINSVKSGDCSIGKAYQMLKNQLDKPTSILEQKKNQVYKALDYLEDAATWFESQQFELDSEDVTDTCVDRIHQMILDVKATVDEIRGFSITSDSGIISTGAEPVTNVA